MAMTSLITIIQIWNSLKRMWQKWWSLSAEWWLSASSWGWVWQRQRIATASIGVSVPLTQLPSAREQALAGLLLPRSGVLPSRSSPPCGPRWVSPPEPAASRKRGQGGRVGSPQGHALEASLLFTSVRTYSQGHIGSTRAQETLLTLDGWKWGNTLQKKVAKWVFWIISSCL